MAKLIPSRIETAEDYIRAVVATTLRVRTKHLTSRDKDRIKAARFTWGFAHSANARGGTLHNVWAGGLSASEAAALANHGCDHPAHQPTKGRKPTALPSLGALVAISGLINPSAAHMCETILHECGHVMCGPGDGHMGPWADACKRLGLPGARSTFAAENVAAWELIEKGKLRDALQALPMPRDGSIIFRFATDNRGREMKAPVQRECKHGWGSMGGKKQQSGGRATYKCQCSPKPITILSTRDDLNCTCNYCGVAFHLVKGKPEPGVDYRVPPEVAAARKVARAAEREANAARLAKAGTVLTPDAVRVAAGRVVGELERAAEARKVKADPVELPAPNLDGTDKGLIPF